MKKNNIVVSIIVPVYNEEDTINQVIEELSYIKNDLPLMEIIIIDDGSTDKTSDLVSAYSSIRYIKHDKNMGKGEAIRTGIKNSNGSVIIIHDADMEYSAENIPELITPILLGHAKVVYGSRFMGDYDGMSSSHYLGNRVLSFVTTILYGSYISDVMTGHKAFSKDIFDQININEKGFDVEVELTSKILKSGVKIIEIPINYSYRSHGHSKISYFDGVRSFFKLFINKLKV
ncbi:glycosyl transferase [Thaumarchaeota archaeon SCGC AB-539-E09]|nr:glycosyl transferase [Thaumarchaeota archaeon SCGC AB-539-E09]